MDDESEESPIESLSPEEELGLDESSGTLRKILPIAAGGVLALALAAFLLNMTGIIHLWGPKKAPSVMIEVPMETETQTLSDSAMEAQFRLDSAQIAGETALLIGKKPAASQQTEKKKLAEAAAVKKDAEKKKLAEAVAAKKDAEKKKLAEAVAIKQKAEEKRIADAAAIKQKAEEKRLADAAAIKQKAEEKRIADAVAIKQKAEEKRIADAASAKQKADEKKTADEVAANILAEKRDAAESVRRNLTYVEVPGYPVRRSAFVEPERKAPAVVPAPKNESPKPVVKTAVAVPAPKKESPKPVVKTTAAVPAPKNESPKPETVKRSVAVKERAPRKTAPATAKRQDAGGEKYSVQISSWLSAAKARMQARQFTDAGIRAFVTTTGRIFRVCIGRYSSHADAVNRAEELAPMLETKYDIIRLK